MAAPPRGAPVLGVFAHPDDETFGPGATLARLAAEGHAVHLVTATRGEAGTMGPSARLGPRALADLREKELAAACGVLGLQAPLQLSLPDGGLAGLAPETLLRPIVRAVRDIRPRAVDLREVTVAVVLEAHLPRHRRPVRPEAPAPLRDPAAVDPHGPSRVDRRT